MELKDTAIAFGILVLSIASTTASRADSRDSPARLKEIRETIQTRLPQIKIVDVKPGPIRGLYEVFGGDFIVYSDDTGSRLFQGAIIDTKSHRNLTVERLNERNAIDFERLPLDLAIKTVHGTGRRSMAIFSDPDCPHCKRLEQALQGVKDVTVYTFLLPLTNVHPDAEKHAHAIWCSKDRAAAWERWMLEQKEPSADCETDPLARIRTLASQLNVTGTPILYVGSGKRRMGELTSDELEKLLTSDGDRRARALADSSAETCTAPHEGVVESCRLSE